MKQLTKRVENFVCAHCGAHVRGNEYTNHCPNCLWSRHVDNTPGDQAAGCGGMMRPIAVEKSGDRLDSAHFGGMKYADFWDFYKNHQINRWFLFNIMYV